jgi:hypothetical protein
MTIAKPGDLYADRRHLSFEQAEGAAALPTQLQLKALSKELRAVLWYVIHGSIQRETHQVGPEGNQRLGDWEAIVFSKHIFRDHGMADEFDVDASTLTLEVKKIMSEGSYLEVFGFLQFVLRHPKCPYQFAEDIEKALKHGKAAYRVLDESTIIPIASEAEGVAIERAFVDLAASEFDGARSHLSNAGSEVTAGNYASSTRESIHAVESVARTLAPSGMLKDAPSKLEKSAAIHRALKNGFLSIYGYTNDEKGIRHPLLDDPSANVDEPDAIFMLGACASFISYMIHKARLAGMPSPEQG